ncbi:Predicted transcriptional regulator [Halomicrobium zhouii]|uniref:Predicted transcriptional regulator n=2 Tax=Halomicrobium zhouii TaxID=767519 RepID=A0A1I6KYU9_9EURY|nr:winged helix-turn-helix transcriptional regulator [Halomicrobium zhouii]SFR96402.1 Predicted transcriptional regulator [Halomicrobium zhouii]
MGMDRLADQVEKERRDVAIFRAVIEHGPIDIASLAAETDLPEHKVRQSVRMLENDGVVEPSQQGTVPPADVEDQVAAINEGVDHLVDRVEELRSVFSEDVQD